MLIKWVEAGTRVLHYTTAFIAPLRDGRTMKQYSDATQMALERALLLLGESLPAALVEVIRGAIEKGTFLNAESILDSAPTTAGVGQKNADK